MNKEKIENKIKKIFESNSFRISIYVLGSLVIIFMVFQIGMMAGFRKASFGRDWGENYEKNFGSPNRFINKERGGFGDFGNLPNAHGAIGKIIKVDLPTIIVFDGKDQTEKVIILDEKTEIRKMREIVPTEGLKVDEHIVVIGNPNKEGQIEARLIRFIPAPPEIPDNIK